MVSKHAGRQYQQGMIYIVLLLGIALIGGATAVALEVAQTSRIRAAEQELLFIGSEFHLALQSYAEATPLGFPSAPETLEELLRDARQPGMRRHLRKIYVDPLTGKPDWELVRGVEKRIVAVHSRSHSETFKRENFPAALSHLANKEFHDQWLFGTPQSAAPAGSNAGVVIWRQ